MLNRTMGHKNPEQILLRQVQFILELLWAPLAVISLVPLTVLAYFLWTAEVKTLCCVLFPLQKSPCCCYPTSREYVRSCSGLVDVIHPIRECILWMEYWTSITAYHGWNRLATLHIRSQMFWLGVLMGKFCKRIAYILKPNSWTFFILLLFCMPM